VSPRAVSAAVEHPDRHIEFEAVHNFRDLGGYPTVDDRVTRWGVLFRADGLHRLTDADLVRFDALGMRTVVDLRTDLEVEQHGAFPHDRHPIAYHHVPVIDATWNHQEVPDLDDVDFLVWAYRAMLDEGGPRFAEAIELLVADGAAPAVFHCAAGKDRTGIVAALVLGAVGVPDEVIVADYARTAEAMRRMQDWVRVNHPELYERYAETPSAFLAAEPAAMQVILDDLRQDHGSVRDAAAGLGVGSEALARLHQLLIAD
jgi:protein-tyrosine phosphatase